MINKGMYRNLLLGRIGVGILKIIIVAKSRKYEISEPVYSIGCN